MRVEAIKSKGIIRSIINDLKAKGQERNFIMFLFGIYTGLRISDILKLRVKDVKGKTHLNIKEDKENKYKSIELHEELVRALKDYCKNKPINEYLIKSKKRNNKPITRIQAYRIIKEYQYIYGIDKNIGCHSLRKTYGYNLYQHNDISIVQVALNHTSQANTLKYIGIEEEELNKAIMKLKY